MTSWQNKLIILISEMFTKRLLLAAGFAIISLGVCVLGLAWPSKYMSYVTIMVDDKSIIKPLMQGAAEATGAADQARTARELLYSRTTLSDVLEFGGWDIEGLTELQKESFSEKIKKRTRVVNIGRNLVKIEFKDQDPFRAMKVADRFSEIFIKESMRLKSMEGSKAFEFIDGQVKEYHKKLIEAESKLKEFRQDSIDARAGTEGDVGDKIASLREQIDKTNLQLKEAIIRRRSLVEQLSGEQTHLATNTRANQYRMRLAELQNRLDTLRLNFHDSYPDVVRVKHQIEDLQEAIEQEKSNSNTIGSREKEMLIASNPLYQEMRVELSNAETVINVLQTRVAETEKLLSQELERGRRVHMSEAVLAELTRDYDVNRTIYQDLLKRRENARLSVNMDKENHGLTLRVYEPAFLPLKPVGLRFLHFAILGLVLGVALPVGLLVVYTEFDPRLKTPVLMHERLGLPVLAVIPTMQTVASVKKSQWTTRMCGACFGTSFIAYLAIGLLKFNGVL